MQSALHNGVVDQVFLLFHGEVELLVYEGRCVGAVVEVGVDEGTFA